MATGPCERCGLDDWYVRPKDGRRDCNACRRVEQARKKKLRKEREAGQIPIPRGDSPGVGPERAAEMKAMFDAPTVEERWDKAEAYADNVLAAADDPPPEEPPA